MIKKDLENTHQEHLVSAEWRLDWLKRQTKFNPHPYEQLASAFRELGKEEEVKKVLIQKQIATYDHVYKPQLKHLLCRMNIATYRIKDVCDLFNLLFIRTLWERWILGVTIGYGQRVSLAILWAVIVMLCGACLVYPHAIRHVTSMSLPADSKVHRDALRYSISVILPMVQQQATTHLPKFREDCWRCGLADLYGDFEFYFGLFMYLLIGWALTGKLSPQSGE